MSLIASFGASIVPVSRADGGFLGSIRLSEAFAANDPRVFLPCQFSNDANVRAHFGTTGPEIWLQLQQAGLEVEAFVAGVGTGGTVMGAGRYLRNAKPPCGCTRSSRRSRPRSRPGARSASIASRASRTNSSRPSSSWMNSMPVVAVHDGDAILMAQQLRALRAGCRHLVGGQLSRRVTRAERPRPRDGRGDRLRRQQQEVLEHGPAAP